ncbi:MAG TPA: DNA polymerase III subunit delta, partial [Spirochaetota bacterium]
EEGDKERYIDKIADKFLGKKPDDRLISHFHCESGEIAHATQFSLESAMFSERKIAVIYNIQSLIAKKDQSFVAQIIDEIPDSTIVIFTSPENSPPKYISPEILGKTRPVIFWRMFESELQAHITKRVRDEGRTIDPHAVTRILSLTGRDLHKVNEAVDRVLAGSDGSISERVVVSLIADEREISVFEFIDALFKRRKDTLRLLSVVIGLGENELGVLALIQREADRIENYHLLRQSGKMHDEAIAELKINPRNADDFMAYTQSFDADRVRRLIILLSRVDYSAKSTRVSRSLLSNPLSELIVEFVR